MSVPPPGCRQRRGNCFAASQTTERHESQRAEEMPALRTARKTKNRFPLTVHERLEIALAISTFPQPRPRPPWKKWKSKNRIPTFPQRLPVSIEIKNERRSTPAQNPVLQAHLRIGICLQDQALRHRAAFQHLHKLVDQILPDVHVERN